MRFPGDASGNIIDERVFQGPLQEQVRDCVGHLQNLSTAHFRKVPDAVPVQGWVSYPLPAVEETIVNAVYHRSYDSQPEPVKVYLYPDRMEIVSYPGPVPGIEPKHLEPGARVPPVPARNRRIGEFLKELRLAEGRGTGIPKVYGTMARNGSPGPRYDFDETRTYFRVTLPSHPEYVAISALRDAAQLDAVGDREGALQRLEQAHAAQPSSGTVAAKLIATYAEHGRLPEARAVHDGFLKLPDTRFAGRVTIAMASALLAAKHINGAQAALDTMPSLVAADETVEAAVLELGAHREERAHALFMKAGDPVFQDPRALYEFARTKVQLANPRRQRKNSRASRQEAARGHLLREAKEMLQRVLQIDAGSQRRAWAWYHLGRVVRWLGEPRETSEDAFRKARELAPHDEHLRQLLDAQQGSRRCPGCGRRRSHLASRSRR